MFKYLAIFVLVLTISGCVGIHTGGSASNSDCDLPRYVEAHAGEELSPSEIRALASVGGLSLQAYSDALGEQATAADRANYLTIGMYGLCQLHANGGLDADQLAELTEALIINAAASIARKKR